VAPWAQPRVLTAALVLACLSTACLTGCTSPDPAESITVSWTLDPSPPIVGEPIAARLTLRDRHQQPVTGARLRLEGLMSHPGMAPVMAAIVERGDGTYEAALRFTMAGDWILLVTGELPGGAPLTKRIEIAGVRPAS
jgi:hypothetical protein